ncbi:DMT family transporter [Cocleimonas sp. KMM 6892]|uniref:DMT family transporter n=1 Tax=unclassified Cocleimonas TaxID=2639732 RepID=UPI002DBE3C0C|nr:MULTISPECIES: DMT family transporter [unclassified Cocleimonas]MEB8432072.1 DMT family transporter [Cocleimonas sp. KMM 6892]MEC4714842.1 DMT family transporter [Cocleimonas sp. KMM 6895]MEC4744344.1 DMT family transporter [Cocleimonas sp. KMM 6896]
MMTKVTVLLLIFLAAIWGSSFIFMRASVESFGPVGLIALRIIVAALCMFVFLLKRRRFLEFVKHWRILLIVGLLNSAIPFLFLAYASLNLTGGTVSILNAMTPVFTAWITHIWLHDKMTKLQFFGMFLSITGLVFLAWDKVSLNLASWLPILSGVSAAISYGIATNLAKRYLADVSIMTSTSGSLFFSGIFMSLLLIPFMPDVHNIPSIQWIYGIALGSLCTALAYIIYFNLIKSIGPMKTASVTFLIPIFSFIWGYLLLGERVTLRMWIATAIILCGMCLVMGLIKKRSPKL